MTTQASRSSLTTLVMILVILAMVGGGVALMVTRHGESAVATEGSAPVAVRVQTAAVKDVPEVVTYSGRIEAEVDVMLAAEQSGRVVWLGADKGDAVRQGQPLLRVDSRVHTANVERAEASLRQAADDFKRLEEMRRAGAVSESELENMRTRRDLARIELDEARIHLDKCQLASPVSGILVDRQAELGAYAAPGQTVFHLAAIDRVKVQFDVPERDVFAVQPGLEVPFTIDSAPGRAFSARVSFVAPAADKRSNTFRAEMLIDNADHFLKPGIIVNVAVTRRIMRDALTVPLEALIPSKGQYLVYVVENGHAVRRLVNLATIVDSLAALRDGLKAGDRVVVDGQRRLSDGSPVSETAGESK